MSQTKNGKAYLQEYNFPQPKEKQTFAEMIYNKKEGTIFGRTVASWSKLGLFYVIFYILLAGMFAICMQGLLATLSDQMPRWQLETSIIGTNPGLGFRPLSDETERGSIIQFDTKKPDEGKYWVELLNDFLELYNHTGTNKKFCSFNQKRNESQVCVVDTKAFGPCSPENGYGYTSGRPCVFLKLNRIYGWEPVYYENSNELPEDMPADLRNHIANTTSSEMKQVWVSCRGQHSPDAENMGEISFYPSRGFPSYYYPFLNQKGYLSPLIAVQFEKLTINQMVTIECRAWAKNILYSGSARDRMGSVIFQLLID